MKPIEKWNIIAKEFTTFLQEEKGLSKNTILSYTRDVHKWIDFLTEIKYNALPHNIQIEDIQLFTSHLLQKKISKSSQCRIISGLRLFYSFCIEKNHATNSPLESFSMVYDQRPTPTTLTTKEIDNILQHIPIQKANGLRNRAMIELLYSTGIKITELMELQIHQLLLEQEVIKIIDNQKQERIVPLCPSAISYLKEYLEKGKLKFQPQEEYMEYVFFNKYGKPLSRIMAFMIIKKCVQNAGIQKIVNPSIFRHSFAAHLLENGADIRLVKELLGHEWLITTEIYTTLQKK